MYIIIAIGIIVLFGFFSWVFKISQESQKYQESKERIDNLDKEEEEFKEEREKWKRKLEERKQAIEQIAKEKSEGFPWLAKAFADYFYFKNLEEANYLETKPHPARKSAEKVREIARKRREVEKQFRIVKYLLHYYENLFPWLVDFRGEDLDDLIKQILEKPKKGGEYEIEGYDPARKWLTKGEYEKLPQAEKFQLALDRYWSKKKSRWEIGRDYERYVGYLYETDKYNVYYQGIVEGLADLGRDVIATKDDKVDVIQCKYWSQHKVIHEKHICQFKGTVLKYVIENPDKKVFGRFFTSTKLSDTAKKFAKALEIDFIEDFKLKPYPSIKCNVSRKNNEKIYHLPFDQQYDRTIIEQERNECYVKTVPEAEKLGYRRAFRWQGENKNN
ncbi:hypothetical protein AMJ47_00590 [Parcubacteria bacterium DG_72]|nr:MAG: hypothetical protein AMJ47_00590 [Parcubacteria bacterium DG_72]